MKFRRTKDGNARPWRRRGAELRKEDPTKHADLEPQHDQPWVPRSGLSDRIRRSPRQ